MPTVADRVKEVVAEQFGVTRESLHGETHFFRDLGADSLDVTELVMELEEEFHITIPDEVAEKIQTVGQAAEHIEKAVQNHQSAE